MLENQQREGHRKKIKETGRGRRSPQQKGGGGKERMSKEGRKGPSCIQQCALGLQRGVIIISSAASRWRETGESVVGTRELRKGEKKNAMTLTDLPGGTKHQM